MVVLDVQFDNFPVSPFADRGEDSGEFALDLGGCENLTSVFGSPDQVVFQIVKAVC